MRLQKRTPGAKANDLLDLDKESIERRNDDFNQTLIRIENKIDKVEVRMDSQFKWTLGLFFGLYISVVGGLVGIIANPLIYLVDIC